MSSEYDTPGTRASEQSDTRAGAGAAPGLDEQGRGPTAVALTCGYRRFGLGYRGVVRRDGRVVEVLRRRLHTVEEALAAAQSRVDEITGNEQL